MKNVFFFIWKRAIIIVYLKKKKVGHTVQAHGDERNKGSKSIFLKGRLKSILQNANVAVLLYW